MLQGVPQTNIFKYFYEISQIPRNSFHEEKIADYIELFAKERGLEYTRDKLHNIIIRKPGSSGRETEAPILLQAHIDMVCAKDDDSDHDFTKDPIDIIVKDGWLKGNKTTLGADDGAGVAYILSILDEPGLSHPPLECVLTVQEENGMGGAKGLDKSVLKSRRMIGLDGIEEGTTIFSASAVHGFKFKMDFKDAEAREMIKSAAGDSDISCYEITVNGLTSGHGALMIGAERANAIKVMARLLRSISKSFGLELGGLNGGGLIHVIPGECTAYFAANAPQEEISDRIAPVEKQIKQEYAITDPGMAIKLKPAAYDGRPLASVSDSANAIELLYLLPVGAYKRSPEYLERVEGSFNLSIMKMDKLHMEFDYICRSNYPVNIEDLADVARTYADLFGAEYETTMEYAGHYVPLDAPLIKLWQNVYKENTGKELGMTYIHSAQDAGTICEALGIKDLVVVVPTVLDVHTTRERMPVDSFIRSYDYLCQILEQA